MNKRPVALCDKTLTVLGTPVAVGDKAKDVTLTDGMIGQHPDYEAARHALKAMP